MAGCCNPDKCMGDQCDTEGGSSLCDLATMRAGRCSRPVWHARLPREVHGKQISQHHSVCSAQTSCRQACTYASPSMQGFHARQKAVLHQFTARVRCLSSKSSAPAGKVLLLRQLAWSSRSLRGPHSAVSKQVMCYSPACQSPLTCRAWGRLREMPSTSTFRASRLLKGCFMSASASQARSQGPPPTSTAALLLVTSSAACACPARQTRTLT